MVAGWTGFEWSGYSWVVWFGWGLRSAMWMGSSWLNLVRGGRGIVLGRGP